MAAPRRNAAAIERERQELAQVHVLTRLRLDEYIAIRLTKQDTQIDRLAIDALLIHQMIEGLADLQKARALTRSS